MEEAGKVLGKQRVVWVKNWKGVRKVLYPKLEEKDYVLLKGSRSIHLDNVVSSL